MSKTLAIVHAPGAKQAQLNMLVEKFRDFMDQIDFNGTQIQVNPDPILSSDKYVGIASFKALLYARIFQRG